MKLTGEDRIRLHAERDRLIDEAIFLLDQDRHWRPALDCLRRAEEITQEIAASLGCRVFRVEVLADNSGKWCGNERRFATREEAEAYAKDLAWRWTLVRDWRVVEEEDE
jgi:hypothetical protein